MGAKDEEGWNGVDLGDRLRETPEIGGFSFAADQISSSSFLSTEKRNIESPDDDALGRLMT